MSTSQHEFLYVGVDVAKATLDVALGPDTQPFTVNNHSAHIQQQLLPRLPAPGQCLITLEGSGGYERLLVAELLDAGHRVARANPRQVRDFAKGLGILAKTDRIDARVLARFGQTAAPRCLEKPTAPQAELQQLIERRRQLIDLRTAESNRLQQVSSKIARRSIQAVLKTLQKQIDSLEQEIASLIDQHDDWKRKTEILTSTPGVGNITAMSLLADLPELGQLNRQQIAALAGLAPFNRDSGVLKGTRSIRGGRAAVRTTLYMAALSAMRCNPALQDFAQRLKHAGKEFKRVITACMRKLLVILNTLVKNNTLWHPQNTL